MWTSPYLRQAPGFDKDDWPDMTDLSWSNRVHGFWMGRDGDVLHRRVMSAGSLAGDAVRNRAGEDLGTIEATMVDLADGRVVYAVLEFGGTLGFGSQISSPFPGASCASTRTRSASSLMPTASGSNGLPGIRQGQLAGHGRSRLEQPGGNAVRPLTGTHGYRQ